MAERCWICGKAEADPASAFRAVLWSSAGEALDAQGHAVATVDRARMKIELPVPSCRGCATFRRREAQRILGGTLMGALVFPLLYEVSGLAGAPPAWEALLIAAGIGAAVGLLAAVLLSLLVFNRLPDRTRRRSILDYPEVARMIALGWCWESPSSD